MIQLVRCPIADNCSEKDCEHTEPHLSSASCIEPTCPDCIPVQSEMAKHIFAELEIYFEPITNHPSVESKRRVAGYSITKGTYENIKSKWIGRI